jgi:hypothetical protein
MSSSEFLPIMNTHWLDRIIARHQRRWFRSRAARAIVRDIARHPEGVALAFDPALVRMVETALCVAQQRFTHKAPVIVARQAILTLLGMRSSRPVAAMAPGSLSDCRVHFAGRSLAVSRA